jgi:hypothetical protein
VKASPLVAAFLILTASFVFTPTGAAIVDPLVADAGVSQVSFDQTDLVLAGKARGGVAPYAYAWTGAAASRFSDPASATPVFSTVGLPVGNLTLTLTVTDFLGTVVSDTVKLRMDDTAVVLNAMGTVPAGVDDESLGESLDARTHSFVVPPRTGLLRAKLSWDATQTPTPDFDLSVLGFDGADVDPSQGATSGNPETFQFTKPFQGTWRAVAEPRAGANARYAIEARVGSFAYIPEIFAMGPYEFGTTDAQTVDALARGTVGPYSFEWDFDHDGWFETSGEIANASLPVGVHTITVRTTDANGFSAESATTLTVRDAEQVHKLVCGGDAAFPYWAMEFSASRGTCWIHGGHHTYYMRGAYTFEGATGLAYAVEQEFAPSLDAVNLTHPLDAPVYLEVSLDGLAWTEVGQALYAYGPQRQYVWFDEPGAGQPFRFIRLRAPLSASQGLSGYLDHSDLRIAADPLVTGVAASSATSKSLDCASGLMEDFFALHPCWFGGVDRYDAPSFYHTYPVGGSANLTRVKGEFTLGPWRSDDFFAGSPLLTVNKTKAFVQVSTDGMAWTDVATIHASYGVPQPFNVTLPGTEATFVRLFPEYHANFDAYATLAPHHHPRAYFLDSRVTLEGSFVEWV